MADDPTAGIPEKCPWCQSERKTVFLATDFHGNPFPCELRSWNCNSGWDEKGRIAQSHCCREECLNRQLATVTAERDHYRRRYVELYSTVWGEQYADFEDSGQKHAEAMEEVERCNRALLEVKDLTAERDRLRVMAELLEQSDGFTSLMLPCSAELITYGDGKWVIAGRDEIYPTARAAISAAMGWQERSGT